MLHELEYDDVWEGGGRDAELGGGWNGRAEWRGERREEGEDWWSGLLAGLRVVGCESVWMRDGGWVVGCLCLMLLCGMHSESCMVWTMDWGMCWGV